MSDDLSRLQRGEWAPNFDALDIRLRPFTFKDINESAVWLAFYRYAACPMCNAHFDDVMSRSAVLQRHGIRFVAVFESDISRFPKRYMKMDYPSLSILPDPQLAIYETYGIERSIFGLLNPSWLPGAISAYASGYRGLAADDGSMDRLPAHFLILPGGYIHTAHYGKHVGDNVKWRYLDEFYEAVDGARSQINEAREKFVDEDVDKTVRINRK